MKLIIAGGRNYKFTSEDIILLDNMRDKITEIVSGGATGADTEGVKWGRAHNLPCRIFFPIWRKFGRSAGHIRNRDMAIYADAVVLFPGGRGTESMYQCAITQGIIRYDYRKREEGYCEKIH